MEHFDASSKWVDSVHSAADLVELITQMRSNLIANPEDWENHTLGRFLEALAAWLDSFPAYYRNTGRAVPDPDWHFIAEALLAARIYE
jgi:hypothetical protein